MEQGSSKLFTVDPAAVLIPDEGLGNFRSGFTEERIRFKLSSIFWNIVPFAGQVIFLSSLFQFLWLKTHSRRVLLYEHGFIRQTLNFRREVKKETVFRYDGLKGMLLSKTRRYTSTYGIRKYGSTSVSLTILDSDNVRKNLISGSYRNENEKDDDYSFAGHVCHAINKDWLDRALFNFNDELVRKGYGSFVTSKGEVRVGKDFINVGNEYVSGGFRYSFEDGNLYLFPDMEENAKFKRKKRTVTINVSGMYNKEIFLMALNQFHGVRL